MDEASSHAPSPELRVRDLTTHDWPVIEQLFGSNGACGGCWCMTWRVPGGKAWREQKGDKNKRAFKQLVASGGVHGCLAFSGDAPVGWCCIGPKHDFAKLAKSKALASDADESTWSVTCFYIPARWRGRGVATALLARAERLARARGASALEGYPVRPHGAKSVPAAFAWTGVPKLFERAGFEDVTRAPDAHPIHVKRFS